MKPRTIRIISAFCNRVRKRRQWSCDRMIHVGYYVYKIHKNETDIRLDSEALHCTAGYQNNHVKMPLALPFHPFCFSSPACTSP